MPVFTANGSLELSVGFALDVAFTIDDSTGTVALVDGTRNLTGVTAPDAGHPLVDNDSDLALFVSAGPSADFNAKAVFGFVEGFATLLPGEANGLYATVLVSDLQGTPSIRIDGSADANLQLAGFPVARKGHPAIDHLADYEQDSCMIGGFATSKLAVDVADREMDDFIWQRGAWRLRSAGDPDQLFPATDYLAAYWAARRHDLIADDRVGTCTRWAP